MQPVFNPPQGGYKAELLCPKCNSNYLHHYRVEVFDREEDHDNGLHTIIEGIRLTTDINLTGNPSKRRHGLLIYFGCENCQTNSVLSIEQHKGNSYFDFIVDESSETKEK